MRKFLNSVGISLLTGLAVACTSARKSADYRVIPLPQEVQNVEGTPFVLDDQVKVLYPQGNADMERNAGFLAQYVKEATGKVLAVEPGEQGEHAIVLSLGLKSENPEAYRLSVGEKEVNIAAPTEAGVFYGIQTLRKSLPIVQNADVALPQVVVNDAPRLAYRGMMLDVGRHFFALDSIKRYIDMLALHNMNRFHWHLTEDQGWRIEIRQYPELTSIGSKRKQTVIGHNSGKYDGIPYGGFYTQEEAREIVAYAKDRYITVVPEIDMPGHMMGALASYPELGCTGGPYEVMQQWGISADVLCAGNPESLEFVKNVLSELIEIFPSEYIHIGGDECPKVRWEKCPKCKAKIKTLKKDKQHSDGERLQSYFISEVEKFLNEHGRQIIGWDEILEGGLAPNATVMSWRGMQGGLKAAQLHHNVVMTPNSYVYFDYYQAKDTKQEPQAIGGYLPIENVYSFEPVPASLTAEEKKCIIGAQANVWTEYMPNFRHVEYMILPRMDALAEVQWTQPEKKNYEDFQARLPRMIDLYRFYGYNYAKPYVKSTVKPGAQDGAEVILSVIGNADIHYTLDGSEPTAVSPKYTGPLNVKENCTLKAIAVYPDGNSRILTEEIDLKKIR